MLAIHLSYGKVKNMVLSITHGAKRCAGRLTTEEAAGIRFLLRSLGVPVHEPTILYGDNIGMLQAVSFPDNTLKKKNSSISYHFLRETVAAGSVVLRYVESSQNSLIC